MTEVHSLERTLLDTTVEQSSHQICSPLQTTPTLYAGIRDTLCPTRAVHREAAWRSC
jgi:hypothetical protein